MVKDWVDITKDGNTAPGSKADGKDALLPVGYIPDLLVGILFNLKNLFGIAYIDFPCFGQSPVGAGTVKQRGAQFLFQLQKLLV